MNNSIKITLIDFKKMVMSTRLQTDKPDVLSKYHGCIGVDMNDNDNNRLIIVRDEKIKDYVEFVEYYIKNFKAHPVTIVRDHLKSMGVIEGTVQTIKVGLENEK